MLYIKLLTGKILQHKVGQTNNHFSNSTTTSSDAELPILQNIALEESYTF